MIDKAAILAEILALTQPPRRQAGDIDAQEYAQAASVSEQAARRRLEKLVAQGVLESLLAFDPERQRQVRVWRKKGHSIEV